MEQFGGDHQGHRLHEQFHVAERQRETSEYNACLGFAAPSATCSISVSQLRGRQDAAEVVDHATHHDLHEPVADPHRRLGRSLAVPFFDRLELTRYLIGWFGSAAVAFGNLPTAVQGSLGSLLHTLTVHDPADGWASRIQKEYAVQEQPAIDRRSRNALPLQGTVENAEASSTSSLSARKVAGELHFQSLGPASPGSPEALDQQLHEGRIQLFEYSSV